MSERETALRAAAQKAVEHMDRAGGDACAMPECPWCHAQGERDGDEYWHEPDCELIALREALAAQPVDAPQPCPHCKLPAVMPDTCTPELNAVIEQQIAEKWALLNTGYALGKQGDAPQPCVWREAPGGAHVYAGCTPNDPYPFLREEARQFSVCPYCAQSLRFPASPVPAAQETTLPSAQE